MRTNRVVILFDDHELQQVEQAAGLVPLSTWIRAQLFPGGKDLVYYSIPRGEELAAGEASARGNDASGEVASRRLPKAAKPQKSIPVDLPKLDMSICPHNMTKAACPRCK